MAIVYLDKNIVSTETYNELYHHGILGMHWGIRKYQNNDGSLTAQGRLRYGVETGKQKLSDLQKRSMKSLNSKWVDTLDKYNQKGYLDWLDSKADAPFSATRSMKRYTSTSAKDPFKAFENLQRYLDMDAHTKTNSPETRGGQFKEIDQNAFRKLASSYNSRYTDAGKRWADAIRERTGQSVLDKKLRMLSREASDQARSKAGEAFIKAMDKAGWDVNDLSRRWYGTDQFGRKKEFSGLRWEETPTKILKPKYKEVVTPEHIKTKFFRYFKGGDWDTRPGIMGRKSIDSKSDDTLYPWVTKDLGDAYGGVQTYVDLPTFWRVPEERKVVRDGWKEVDGVDIDFSKPTKEFLEWERKSKFPSDYSNVTDAYTRKFNEAASKGIDWLEALSHSDSKYGREVMMQNDLVYSSIASSKDNDEIYHHGTKGQKWGHRRYQNKDGSLTDEGRKHYGVGKAREIGEKLANAVRKRVKPTTEDLLERKRKAEEKARQREIKEEIKDLKKPNRGKKLNELSDDELRQKMERMALEKQYKEIEKSSKTSKGKEAFKNAMKRAATRAAANALEAGITALGVKVANNITMNSRERLGEAEADLKRSILTSKDPKKFAEAASKLQAYYKATKRDNNGDKKPSGDRLRDAENELKLRALSGDKDAQQQLVDYRKANDPFKKPRSDSNGGGNGGNGGNNPNKPSGGGNGGNGGNNPNKPSGGGNGGNGGNPNKPSGGGNGGKPKDYEQSHKDRQARISERQKQRDNERAAKKAQQEEAKQRVRDGLEEATKQAKKHTDDVADLLRRASDAAKKGKRQLQDQMDDNIPEAVKQYQKSVDESKKQSSFDPSTPPDIPISVPKESSSTDSGQKQADSHKDDPVTKKPSPPEGYTNWDDYINEKLVRSLLGRDIDLKHSV